MTDRNKKGQFLRGIIPWSKKHKGIHLSPKSEFKKGFVPWNKGKSGYKTKPCTEERKKKIGDAQRGEKNHAWRGGKPKCIDCGKLLSQHHQKNKRCRACWGKTKRGANCHFWKGGIAREPYSEEWRETLKRSIRERDKYICLLCGVTQIDEIEKTGRKLAVHHIDYDKKNCDPNNLITLCVGCNSRVNFDREYWIEYFKT